MHEISTVQFSRLVGLLYDIGDDPQRWTAFLAELSTQFEGARITLKGQDLRSGLSLGVVSAGWEPGFLESYAAYYGAINPWVGVLAGMQVGVPGQPEQRMPFAELQRTEFYNDWLRPQGIGTAAALLVKRDTTRLFSISADFGLAEAGRVQVPLLSLLELLAPHVARAFDLTGRIARIRASEAFQSEFAASEDPALLLDASGRVVQSNAHGESLRRRGDPFHYDAAGRLVLVDADAQSLLERGLRALAAGTTSATLDRFAVRTEHGAWEAALSPHHRSVGDDLMGYHLANAAPIALLHLHRPSGLSVFAAAARLTEAEAHVVAGLLEAKPLSVIAAERNVSINTIRNQLKAVFGKSGLHRQAEVVAAVRRATPHKER